MLVSTCGPLALGVPMIILGPNAEKSSAFPILKSSVLHMRCVIVGAGTSSGLERGAGARSQTRMRCVAPRGVDEMGIVLYPQMW